MKEVSVEDSSGAVTVSGRQCPFTIAPGERFDARLTVAAGKDSGKARLRLVCSTPKYKKDPSPVCSGLLRPSEVKGR